MNYVYQGSNVQSGTARCLVVATGSDAEYGSIAQTLRAAPPETEFDRGLRHFGYLLVKMMLLITVVVFTVHLALERPALETLLFAIVLAVGLSPELLPAILSVNRHSERAHTPARQFDEARRGALRLRSQVRQRRDLEP